MRGCRLERPDADGKDEVGLDLGLDLGHDLSPAVHVPLHVVLGDDSMVLALPEATHGVSIGVHVGAHDDRDVRGTDGRARAGKGDEKQQGGKRASRHGSITPASGQTSSREPGSTLGLSEFRAIPSEWRKRRIEKRKLSTGRVGGLPRKRGAGARGQVDLVRVEDAREHPVVPGQRHQLHELRTPQLRLSKTIKTDAITFWSVSESRSSFSTIRSK